MTERKAVRMRRTMAAAALIVSLLASGGVLLAQTPPPNTWTTTASMGTPRSGHTLTLLMSGEALAAGGCDTFFCNDAVATSETYDPVARSWSPAGTMTTQRNEHSATLLMNGTVLVTGGCIESFACDGLASSELFLPATRTWSATGSMSIGRTRHTATMLADGRVLVAGGISVCNSQTCNPIASVEIYEPSAGTWHTSTDMPTPRVGHTATLLTSGEILVTGGCSTNGPPCAALGAILFNPSSETWSNAAPMFTNRMGAQAIPLFLGEVLVAGGVDESGFVVLAAERYSPATRTWIASGTMTMSRFESTATFLGSGRVIVAGGNTNAAELYLPSSVNWTATGRMNQSRASHAAAALVGVGEVLVSGGVGPNNEVLATAEIYHPGLSPLTKVSPTSVDFGLQEVGTSSEPRTITISNLGDVALTIASATPAGPNATDFAASLDCHGPLPPGQQCAVNVQFSPGATRNRAATLRIVDNAPDSPQVVALSGFGFVRAPNQWAPTGTMTRSRQLHTATELAGGKVLVAGGSFSRRAERYDPATGEWRPTGSMAAARFSHTATLLLNGQVLAAGGGTATAELYTDSTRRWHLTRSMSRSRMGHAATLLPSGRVLVTGGCGGQPCADAEIYDPASGRWFRIAPMKLPRAGHTSTLLPGGRVLVVGGAESHASAELYDPSLGAWFLTGPMMAPRQGHTATLLGNGAVLVAGGCGDEPCASAEIYNPITARWTPAGRLRVPRLNHTATLLEDGRVLVAGGIFFCDPEFGFCFTTEAAEIYHPGTGLWTRTGNMIVAREFHTASRLEDGRVLVAGGFDSSLAIQYASSELFTP